MKIMITDKLGIRRLDANNIIVFENRVMKKKDTDEEYVNEVTLGYHPTIQSCARSIERKLQATLEGNDINVLLKEVNALRESIDSLMNDLKGKI